MGKPSVMLLAGLALLIVGFGIQDRGGAVPHVAPDVYDGSPTPVTAFMATGVKAAAFAALFRVLNQASPRSPPGMTSCGGSPSSR